MQPRIEPFRPEHAAAFATLNRAWLVDNGLYEHPDEYHLEDPWGRIIEPGGQIFVALLGDEVVGTCAIVPEGPGSFELAKLTVAPDARGHGLGRLLVEACIEFARGRGARRVELLSNSRLVTAIRLYESLGFEHRPVPPDVKYLSANVHMVRGLPSPSA